ncbi:ETEC_3214 domain-containing protein [Aeromonas enteropelogenes]|uniref:ETEC_3214 domain-containing protein n=1 Tax=Aeromonas enteropelogenes TaxID=29489 RepID=UPI0038D1C083
MRRLLISLRVLWPYIAGIMLLVGYLNDLHGIYGNYIKQKRAEDDLELLNTGVSIQHVKSVFGSPIVEQHDKENGLSEYVYSFKRFYLQTVFNNNNEVIFFAVTSKDKSFHPTVPYLNDNLGKTFYALSNNYSENQANYSSKFFEYNENIYLGNMGNYRNVYLAFNPAGVDYGDIEMLPLDEMPTPSDEVSDSFRKKSHPNTYGVGRIMGGRNDHETIFGVGIEYFTSRDLPEHQY